MFKWIGKNDITYSFQIRSTNLVKLIYGPNLRAPSLPPNTGLKDFLNKSLAVSFWFTSNNFIRRCVQTR